MLIVDSLSSSHLCKCIKSGFKASLFLEWYESAILDGFESPWPILLIDFQKEAQSVFSVVENLAAGWVTIQTCLLIGEMLCGRAGLDQSRGNSTCLTNFASYLTQALQIINFEICASRCIGAWIYNVHGASVCWKWCWISGGSNFWGGARRGQQRWRVRNSGGGAIQRNLPNYILVSEIEGKESVRYCWIVVDHPPWMAQFKGTK